MTLRVAACVGKKFATIQQPATQHKQSLFPLQQQSLRHLMTFLVKLGFIFCLSLMITLIWPQTSLLWKGFPHSPPSMWGNCYFGFVPRLYKGVLFLSLSFIHKHNSSTGVGGNIFFSAGGCYVLSVWGKCGRTKVAGEVLWGCRREAGGAETLELNSLQLFCSLINNFTKIC